MQDVGGNGIVDNMLTCQICQKGSRKIAYSRHKKGSSGAGGTWALRAPIHQKTQKVNIHHYQGMKLCTKCQRAIKSQIQPKKQTTTPITS
ncbi:MAG: hypothetical protein Q7R97_03530 [Candidatus Daviesbacteria bacterium]|nr:hypothetical protein [Candidatus Daviesbacteria bacterium]